LRSGKSNTNGNTVSEPHTYGNADSFTARTNYPDSTVSPHSSTAPVTSLFENKTHYSIRIL
jgi:hypothetical protein